MHFEHWAEIVREISQGFIQKEWPKEKYLFEPLWGAFKQLLEQWLERPSDEWPVRDVAQALPAEPGLTDGQVVETGTVRVVLTVSSALSDFVRLSLEQRTERNAGEILRRSGQYFGIGGSLLERLRERFVPLCSLFQFALESGAKVTEESTQKPPIAESELERVTREIRKLEKVERHDPFVGIIGKSEAVRALVGEIDKVRETDATVLVTGESGVGKELVAQAIQFKGSRPNAPFIVVNLPAIPQQLIESELFGHVRGAFTGADKEKKGMFELAHGGTIFLDEIGDLKENCQVKLHRVLQQGEVQRIGDTKPIRLKVRVIAATNRDLEEAVADGRFRDDLFHRLYVFPIHVLALRERKEDIPLLAEYFATFFSHEMNKPPVRFTPEAIQRLLLYDWPGNIRQLQNCIHGAIIRARGNVIDAKDFLFPRTKLPSQELSREELEKDRIIRALSKSRTIKEAARRLNMARSTLYVKLEKYNIAPFRYLKGH